MLNCCIIIEAGSMTSSFGCISEMINSGAFEKYRYSAPVFIRRSGKLYFTKLPHSFLISCQGLKPSIIFLPGYKGTFHDEEGEPVMVTRTPGLDFSGHEYRSQYYILHVSSWAGYFTASLSSSIWVLLLLSDIWRACWLPLISLTRKTWEGGAQTLSHNASQDDWSSPELI